MKRRFFINSLSGILLGANISKSSDSSRNKLQKKDDQDSNTARPESNSNNNIVLLLPGAKFDLPSNPSQFDTIHFTPGELNWKKNPPLILSEKFPIMGKNESLLADTNISFGLRFVNEKAGWVYFPIG